jgi:hypothetical protein
MQTCGYRRCPLATWTGNVLLLPHASGCAVCAGWGINTRRINGGSRWPPFASGPRYSPNNPRRAR